MLVTAGYGEYILFRLDAASNERYPAYARCSSRWGTEVLSHYGQATLHVWVLAGVLLTR